MRKYFNEKKDNQRSYPMGTRTSTRREPFMGKKGEMTTEQIVVLVIAIASFAVIIFFLASLGLGENTEDELCRNSVAQRGSLDKLPGVSPDTIPLKCEKSYICLTKDGSCENMYKPEFKKVKTKAEVYEVLAEELANCWWMFGEGKINYGGEDFLENLYCAHCSQIAFDDSVKEIFPSGEFSENELYKELMKINKTKDETYFEYLFGSVSPEEFLKQDYGKISLDSQYYSLTGVTGSIDTLGYIIGGAVLAAFVAGTGGLGVIVISATVATGAVVGGVAGGAIAATIDIGKNTFIPPTLTKVNSEEFKAFDCDYVITSS